MVTDIKESDIPIKMKTAYQIALLSPDKSTRLGALICQDGWNVAAGVNSFVKGFGYKPHHHERPFKYWVTEHAERRAIFSAFRSGFDIKGLTLICPWVCCPDCARAIVLSGLKHVVCHEECMQRTPERWKEMIDTGLSILEHGGVELVRWSGKVGDVQNLNNGEIWYP